MSIFEELKSRVTVVELAAEAGVDTTRGKTVCPFCHYEKAPSFHVTDEYFRCHHCDAKGGVIEWVMRSQDVDSWEAAKTLGRRVGLDIRPTREEIVREERSVVFRRFAEKYRELPGPAHDYLRGRGLSDEFIADHLIGWIPEDAPEEDDQALREAGLPYLLRGRVMIPFWQGRQIVYFTGRLAGEPSNGTPKFKNQKGHKTHIGTVRGPVLWVTEGIFDQLLLEQAGVNAIGIAGSGGKIKLHKGVKRVVMAMDSDDAGRRFTEQHALDFALSGAAVEVIEWPDGVKDAAEYMAAGGQLADLKSQPLHVMYRAALIADKDNLDLKREFYRLIATLDTLTREKEMMALAKLYEVRITAIRQDARDCLMEQDRTEYTGDDGLKFGIPDGYAMGPGGISKGKDIITISPIYIDAVGHSQHSREEFVRLRYGQVSTGAMSSHYASMIEISQSSDLVKMAKFGLPVNSANQIAVIKWLESWMARNRDKFSAFDVVSQLGWIGEDFLLPDRVIRLAKEENPVPIQYIGRVPEDAYRPKGTVAGWSETMRLLAGAPGAHAVRFMIYAAFTSAVLEPLGLRPFIIHLHGDTSEGKTTALKVAASIYGRPDFGGAMIRWNDTETFIVRYCEQLHNVPLIIDELSGETKKNFDALVYQLEGGISKGKADRHDPNAIHRQRTFRLGVFSSGETMMLNDRSLGGAQIRVWELSGSPFGGKCRELVQKIEKGIAANHGVALEHFLRNFLASRETFDNQTSFYQPPGDAPLSNVEERMLRPLQKIYLIGEAINIIFGLGWPVAEDMAFVFDLLRRPVEDSARTVDKIVGLIADHYHENRVSFPSMHKDAMSGKNVPVFEGGKPPPKIFGYRFDNDLGIIKRHFLEFMDDALGRVNGGQYVLNRLIEREIISSANFRCRVDSDQIRLVMLPGFFDDDEEEVF